MASAVASPFRLSLLPRANFLASGGGGGGSSSAPAGRGKMRRYGASRRSKIKKSFTQEQVDFRTPLPDDPCVAVIGGGVAGLVCAAGLADRGVRTVVFDSGMHGLGGRMATRTVDGQPLVFDHAAQFFTASDERFLKLVTAWLQKGLIREWNGLVGELETGGRFSPIPCSAARYIGVNGMRSITDSMALQSSLISIERPCWISKLHPFNGKWRLFEQVKYRGQYDAIVIAHNGKCAKRLLSLSGLPLLHSQMKRLDLSAIWALMAAFKDPLPQTPPGSFEGAFVKGVDSLSWMANNSSKLFPLEDGRPQCWTFFSTAAYGKRNKVPQENIPNATAEKVKGDMLKGVEYALGIPEGSLQQPFYTRLQLWGAALPTNSPGVPCIFDPHGRAGMCGDWLLGSSVEAAAISGMSLANHIADFLESGGMRPEEFAVGLHDTFSELASHDIGQFPGLDAAVQENRSQELVTAAS